MQSILNTLNKFVALSVQVEKELTEALVKKEFKKGELLLEKDRICSQIYFIKSGAARGYYIGDGKEITSWFAFENDIITSMYSFVTQKPGFESIEVLEESVLFSISYERMQYFYLNFPEINFVGRLLTEKYYIELEERAFSLQNLTAAERYQQLITLKPQLLQKASLGHIASYLGISQETLSRIRANI